MQPSVPSSPYGENYQQPPASSFGRSYNPPPTYQPVPQPNTQQPGIFVPSPATPAPVVLVPFVFSFILNWCRSCFELLWQYHKLDHNTRFELAG